MKMVLRRYPEIVYRIIHNVHNEYSGPDQANYLDFVSLRIGETKPLTSIL